MENTTINQGPESPADLQWSQGAKNPRKDIETNIDVNSGLPNSDTTIEDSNIVTETSQDEICPPVKKWQDVKARNVAVTLKKTIRSTSPVLYEAWMLNPLLVIIYNMNHPEGLIDEKALNVFLTELTYIILNWGNNPPKFNGFSYEKGRLLITCHDYESIYWLKGVINWKVGKMLGEKLLALQKDYCGERKRVYAFLPGPPRRNNELLRTLTFQNPFIKQKDIKVCKSRPCADGSGLNATFEVKNFVFKKMKEEKMKLYYGLSHTILQTHTIVERKANIFKRRTKKPSPVSDPPSVPVPIKVQTPNTPQNNKKRRNNNRRRNKSKKFKNETPAPRTFENNSSKSSSSRDQGGNQSFDSDKIKPYKPRPSQPYKPSSPPYKFSSQPYKPSSSQQYKHSSQRHQPFSSQPYQPSSSQQYTPFSSQPYKPFSSRTYEHSSSQPYEPFSSQSHKPFSSQPYKPFSSQSYKPFESQPYERVPQGKYFNANTHELSQYHQSEVRETFERSGRPVEPHPNSQNSSANPLAQISHLLQDLQSTNVLTPQVAQYYQSLLSSQPSNNPTQNHPSSMSPSSQSFPRNQNFHKSDRW